MKRLIAHIMVVIAVVTFALFSGCEGQGGGASLIGSAIGAGVGALAGGSTEATLIGAAVGGGAGYILGNEADKQQSRQQLAMARTQLGSETVWITNSNGSQVPVTLTKDGPGYIGPRGERYPQRPTEQQLRTVYGF